MITERVDQATHVCVRERGGKQREQLCMKFHFWNVCFCLSSGKLCEKWLRRNWAHMKCSVWSKHLFLVDWCTPALTKFSESSNHRMRLVFVRRRLLSFLLHFPQQDFSLRFHSHFSLMALWVMGFSFVLFLAFGRFTFQIWKCSPVWSSFQAGRRA